MTLDPGPRGKVAHGAGAAWEGQPSLVLVSESLQVGVANSAGSAVVPLFSYSLNPAGSGRGRREKSRNVNSSVPNVWSSLHACPTWKHPPNVARSMPLVAGSRSEISRTEAPGPPGIQPSRREALRCLPQSGIPHG